MLHASPFHPSIGNAATVFLAMALHDAGRTDEALRLTIDALIPELPRYRRAAVEYSRALTDTNAEPANRDDHPIPSAYWSITPT